MTTILPLLAICTALGATDTERSEPAHRVAVVVGANAGIPGGTPLRYAHQDAIRMAETLRDVGGFSDADTHLLLDPDPDELLGVLDEELREAEGRETLLLFYYSGHADDVALYPHGERLPFEALRERIEDERAAVRVGIIDACRGGGWTGTKGLSVEAPFEVPLQTALDSTGSVLIASSSGAQSAHETEAIEGSLFTHHLMAGLRGGADEGSDGVITLAEAFDYAKAGTVRDAVLYASDEQHPSFHVNLRGRQDLVLSRVASSDSLVEVQQEAGPLELVELTTGVTVLELQAGTRATKLALVPGRYLLLRRSSEGQYATEFRLSPDETLVITEDQLELVGKTALARKGPVRVEVDGMILPRNRHHTQGLASLPILPLSTDWVHAVLGSAPMHLATDDMAIFGEVSQAISLDERVDLLLPGSLRFGIDRKGYNVVWGGLSSLGITQEMEEGSPWHPTTSVALGLDTRLPLPRQFPWAAGYLAAGVRFGSWGALASGGTGYDGWRLDAYAGFQGTVHRFEMHPSCGIAVEIPPGGISFGPGGTQPGDQAFSTLRSRPIMRAAFGSFPTPGGMREPLLRWNFERGDQLNMALDLYSFVEYSLEEDERSGVGAMIGMSFSGPSTRKPAP